MEKKRKILKFKFLIFAVLFCIFVLMSSVFMLYCAYKQSFGIERTDWLSLLLTCITSCSAAFLGFVAYWQNERFKLETDIDTQKTNDKNDEYQNQLLQVNNRIMKLEENKEYAYIAFIQSPVLVSNDKQNIAMKGKTYISGISNSGKEFRESTFFVFSITNQTDIPIRYFQINKMTISYSDYGNDTDNRIISYGVGGFVASPIISKGESVNYIVVANGISDLVQNLPEGMEINLTINIEVTSIFDRKVIQTFLLRLQQKNAFFDSKENKNVFWNYCYESLPKRE